MVERIPVGLAGVTGYAGMELVRLLVGHPGLELVRATSRSEAGKRLEDLYPFLQGFPMGELVVTPSDPDDLAASCRLVFLAVPHGAAMDMAGQLVDRGVKVVDLSADFRLRASAVYEQWYKLPHRRPDLLPRAVYGLVETNADRLRDAVLTANPGCYPSSVILGLHPALRAGLIETDGIVADCKSGTSGAGRKAAVGTLFCEVSDSFRAYNLAAHRHTPEIEQEVSLSAGEPIVLSFNTHLVPMNRGILSTIYARLKRPAELDEIRAAYEAAYADQPWIRLLPKGRLPETRWTRGTMFCDIGLVTDPRTNRLLVVTAIDNLCRGASGQALACANLMLGMPPDLGLRLAPMMP